MSMVDDDLRKVILMKSCEFDDVDTAMKIMNDFRKDDSVDISGKTFKVNANGDLVATRRMVCYNDGTCNIVEYVIDPSSSEKIVHLSSILPNGERVDCNEANQIIKKAISKNRKRIDDANPDKTNDIISDYLKNLKNYSDGMLLTLHVNQ